MTRRDARIMARRLRRLGYGVRLRCGDGRYWLAVYDGKPGYRLFLCGPFGNAHLHRWLGLSPVVPPRHGREAHP